MRKLFTFLAITLFTMSAQAAPGGLYQNPSTGPSSISGAVSPGVINGTTPANNIPPNRMMKYHNQQNWKNHPVKRVPADY